MRTALSVFLICISYSCLAQSREDIKQFHDIFEVKVHKHNWKKELKDNKNEMTFIFSATFVLYKEVISSQDIDACVFTPSCSVYAIESIKNDGVIVGFFSAMDRLTRCNPGRNKGLPTDQITGKYYDPVEH